MSIMQRSSADFEPQTVPTTKDMLRAWNADRCVQLSSANVYEFRHPFGVHRLTAWATAGVDVHANLPWLSAYLGHLNVLGTVVYLKATPQLLELANGRFEDQLRRARRPQSARPPRGRCSLASNHFSPSICHTNAVPVCTLVRAYRDALRLLFEFVA